MTMRALRVLTRRYLQQSWRNFRTALNVSWLAIRDTSIGWAPKALGAGAALVGIIPLEWVPGIHPLAVLFSNIILIPGLIWLAWLAVTKEHKERLTKQARSMPLQWGFFALIAVIFVLATGVDVAMDLAYPGQDAFTPMIDGWLEELDLAAV